MTSGQKKVSVQDLTEIISAQAEVSKKFSESFLRELIDVIAEYLERDGIVKVKGLGTFKLTWVDGRRSVDVSTGNEIVLPAHYKVGFVPETSVKQAVNEPYSHLSTVVTEMPDDLGGKADYNDTEGHTEYSDKALEPDASDKEAEQPATPPEPTQFSTESTEVRQSSSVTEERTAQPVDNAESQSEKKEEDKNNGDGHKKSVVWIIVAAVVICLSVAFFFSYDVRFPLDDEDEIAVVDERFSHPEEDESAGNIIDLSYADSLYADSVEEESMIVEEQDSLPVTVPIDPIEAYTYKVAMNAPVREYVTVIDGSRLTMVAYRAFGSKDFWVYVYDANRDVLKNPAEVEKGMKLKIPVLDHVLTDPKNPKAIRKARELGKSY